MPELAFEVATEVLGVPGVARLSGGAVGEAVTHYAGGSVVGVRVRERTVEVHVVAGRLPLPGLVDRVRAAARRALDRAGDARAVDVTVDDVAVARLPARGPDEMVTDLRRRDRTGGGRERAEGVAVMADEDKARNKGQELKGKAKEAWGRLSDDEQLEAEGRADQSKANLKQAGEKVKDAFRK